MEIKNAGIEKMPAFGFPLLRDLLINRDAFFITAHALKTDNAVFHGKERIIAAFTHIGAGMDLCATLTNENISSQNELTVRSLRTQTLRDVYKRQSLYSRQRLVLVREAD